MARRKTEAREAGPAADESTREALERARRHLAAAGVELIAAARALLDAASLATVGRSADTNRAFGTLARGLDELSSAISDGRPSVAAPLLEAILDALDVEIARWEQRSRGDEDARAVLRAFLGLREILWEFGVRPASQPDADSDAAADVPDAKTRSAEARSTTQGSDEPLAASEGGDVSRPPRVRRKTTRRRPPPRVQRVEVQ